MFSPPSPNLKQKQTNQTSFPYKSIMCCIRSLCKVYGGKQNHVCYLNSKIHSFSTKGRFNGSMYKTLRVCVNFALPGNWPRNKVRRTIFRLLRCLCKSICSFVFAIGLQLITGTNEVAFHTVLLKFFMQIQCKLYCNSNHLQCTADKQKHYHLFSSTSIASARFLLL